MTIAGLAVGPLERRFGARSVSAAGTAFMGSSFVLMTFSRGAPAEIYTASGLLGIGLSFGIASLAALIVSQVSAAETGEAAGINNVSRTLGGALGGQVSAVLLAGSVVGHGLPSAAGYTRAFAVGLVAMVVAAVIGPLLPGRLEDPTDGVDGTVGAPAELAYRR
jgi:MFS family permease